MTEQLSDGVQIDAGHDELAREGMAQIMRAKLAYVCYLQQRSPRLLDR
jgi:hypothetical protein